MTLQKCWIPKHGSCRVSGSDWQRWGLEWPCLGSLLLLLAEHKWYRLVISVVDWILTRRRSDIISIQTRNQHAIKNQVEAKLKVCDIFVDVIYKNISTLSIIAFNLPVGLAESSSFHQTCWGWTVIIGGPAWQTLADAPWLLPACLFHSIMASLFIAGSSVKCSFWWFGFFF